MTVNCPCQKLSRKLYETISITTPYETIATQVKSGRRSFDVRHARRACTSVSAPITRTKSSSPTNDSGCANGLRTITARPLSSGRPSVLHELVGLARRLVAHAAAAVHVLA